MEQVGKGSTGDLGDRNDGWGFQREITMWTKQASLGLAGGNTGTQRNM